jgi:hypothetical protein
LPARAHADDDGDAGLCRGLHGALQHLGVIGVELAVEEQLDRRRRCRLDTAGDVVVLVEKTLDERAGRGGNVAAAVEHLGDGRDGHAR